MLLNRPSDGASLSVLYLPLKRPPASGLYTTISAHHSSAFGTEAEIKMDETYPDHTFGSMESILAQLPS